MLACDGVWDVFKPLEAVQLVYECKQQVRAHIRKHGHMNASTRTNTNTHTIFFRCYARDVLTNSCTQGKTAPLAAAELARAAIKRGSGDNISCIVLYLQWEAIAPLPLPAIIENPAVARAKVSTRMHTFTHRHMRKQAYASAAQATICRAL